MRYQSLGMSELEPSRIVLGTTMFGELMSLDQARSVVDAAFDVGINAIDTADIYGAGEAETIIGKLLHGRRSNVLIFSKVGFRVGDSPAQHALVADGRMDAAALLVRGIGAHEQGMSRRHIVEALEASLRRLRTDYIDLYQLHYWDLYTPIEETLRALEDLVQAGKVRYTGCSNARSWRLYRALWLSELRELSRFDSMQVPYSLLATQAEQEALPACQEAQVGVIAFQVLAAGALSGAHINGVKANTVLAQRPHHQSRFLTGPNRERLLRFEEFARSTGMSPVTMALDMVLSHSAVTAATVGIQHVDELAPLLAAVERPLDRDTRHALRAIFA